MVHNKSRIKNGSTYSLYSVSCSPLLKTFSPKTREFIGINTVWSNIYCYVVCVTFYFYLLTLGVDVPGSLLSVSFVSTLYLWWSRQYLASTQSNNHAGLTMGMRHFRANSYFWPEKEFFFCIFSLWILLKIIKGHNIFFSLSPFMFGFYKQFKLLLCF